MKTICCFLALLLGPSLCAQAQFEIPELGDPENLSFGSKGLRYQLSEDHFFRLGGRAQYDRAIFNSNETTIDDESNFRRLRLKPSFGKAGSWKVQYSYDFEAESNADAFLAVNISEKSSLIIGQFKTISSLTSRTSSNWLSFTERSPLHSRILNERGLGLGLDFNAFEYFFSGTVLTETLDSSSEGRYPWQLSGLVAYRPILETEEVLHIGVGYVYQITDDSDSLSTSIQSSVRSDSSPSLLGGSLSGTENYQIYNPEFAYLNGPFIIRGEFAVLDPSDNGIESSREAYSFYTSASLFLNGGSPNYVPNRASIGRPNIPKSQCGIWEIASRYTLADLTNTGLGRLSEVGVALNYYINKNIRLSGNINYADIELASDPDEEVLAGQLRAQLVL